MPLLSTMRGVGTPPQDPSYESAEHWQKSAGKRVPALLEGGAHGVSGFEGEVALCSERLGFEERRAGARVVFTRCYNYTGCVWAISAKRQKALASCIWRGLRHSGSKEMFAGTFITVRPCFNGSVIRLPLLKWQWL